MFAKNKSRLLFIVLALVLTVFTAVQAQQQIEPFGDEDIDPNANISWPPPVYVLRGEVAIRGSANLTNMTNYFVEFRALQPEPEEGEETPTPTPGPEPPWFPATLPSTAAVQDDVLGEWDTRTAPDGVYELRLTINLASGDPVHFRVSPIRIENNPPSFVVEPTITPVVVEPPTLAPTPTPLDTTPRVTALVNANVRRGDTTAYPLVGSLFAGEEAPIRGISSTGSGWYFIELANGNRGFISPSTVRVSGDTSNLQRISPPPPPATPTPVPTATPVAQSNLIITGVTIEPATPNCGQAYTIRATIQNVGTGPTTTNINVLAQDVHVGTGGIQVSTVGGVPILNPGQTFVSVMFLTVSTYYNELHRLVLVADSSNQVAELNEGDNVATRDYTLAKASCP